MNIKWCRIHILFCVPAHNSTSHKSDAKQKKKLKFVCLVILVNFIDNQFILRPMGDEIIKTTMADLLPMPIDL